MGSELIGFILLGLAVVLHIGFVSVTLGVGMFTAIYRYLSYTRKDDSLELLSRKSFRLMIVTELFSAVLGTVITVFLAGFFPSLTALATNVLFTPIAISIISIMIRVPSIAAFWYTWGKISPKIHSAIGFIMAISGFGIPFGFRTIFAEITSPTALSAFMMNQSSSPFLAYTSTVFWDLYVHTFIASISVGGFVLVSIFALEKDVWAARKALPFGLIFLVMQPVVGFFYLSALYAHAGYIFKEVAIGSFSPIFFVKLGLASLLFIAGIFLYYKLNQNEIPGYSKMLGIIAIITAMLGEFINDGSRYPYMVVTGDTGLKVSDFFNYMIPISSISPAIWVILAFILISVAVFSLAAYYALIKKFVL